VDSKVKSYLDQFRDGDWDVAFHGLIEEGPQILPELMSAFATEEDPEIRAALVQVVGEHRRMESVPFLSQALDDPDPEVWKKALDALVTVGGESARESLRQAAERSRASGQEEADRAEWIQEALDQVQDRLAEPEPAAPEIGAGPPAPRTREELIAFFEKLGYANLTSPEEFDQLMDYIRKNNIATYTSTDKETGTVTVHKRMLGTIEGFPMG
jgi:HEAT repeat protein